ncbi:MAG: hypothetical protein ABGZ17_18450 [Planctomycetaceae bacterium]
MTADPPLFDPESNGSTSEAGTAIDAGRGRTFPCDGCGADFEFHIDEQNLKCPFCGHEKEITFSDDDAVVEQDFRAILHKRAEQRGSSAPTRGSSDEETNEVRCDSCGGTVVFVGPLTSSECPYCGSPLQRDKVHSAGQRIPVDGVLPFLVVRERAQAHLAQWVQSRWFAPGAFLQRGVEGRFNGVYLPYWTYDSLTCNRYSGQRGEYYYVTVKTGKNRTRQRRTRWYPASGRFQRFFDDVLVLAARGMNRKLLNKLEPWPLGRCQPFTQQLLAGYLARTYEVELSDGFQDARKRIDHALRSDVQRRIGGDTQRISSIDTRHDAITFKHLLLPVWLLAYRYNQKTYQVVVNAGTGEIQGQRPYSWAKILLTTLAVAAIVGGVAFLANQH